MESPERECPETTPEDSDEENLFVPEPSENQCSCEAKLPRSPVNIYQILAPESEEEAWISGRKNSEDKEEGSPDPWANYVLSYEELPEEPQESGWPSPTNYKESEKSEHLFHKVFGGFWITWEGMEGRNWEELPGAGLENADFIELLTNQVTDILLQKGEWPSHYGKVPRIVVYNLYYGERWAKYWIENLIKSYKSAPCEIRWSGKLNE